MKYDFTAEYGPTTGRLPGAVRNDEEELPIEILNASIMSPLIRLNLKVAFSAADAFPHNLSSAHR
jgi:hypothetical protein